MNPDANIATPPTTQETSTATIPKPPVARREPVEHVMHGDRRVDHYAWLRHKENPEVIDYLKAENAYTDAVLKPTEPFQEKLYQEMLGRILQTDLSVPYRLRGYLYFTRTEEGKQYAFHCRQRNVEGAPEELLLDLNLLAEGHSFLGLDSFEVSEDNQLLAYSTDTTGFRQYVLQVKDLSNGTTLPERFERVTSVAWASDNRTLLYTVEDETTKRSHRLYRHVLGSAEPDSLIYDETDERFRIEVERTRSGAFLLLTIASHTASEVRYLRADQPTGEFRLIAPREDNHEYYAEHHPIALAAERYAVPLAAGHTGPQGSSNDGVFYMRTNSGGRTFRLMAAPVSDPRREFWHEVIPNRPYVSERLHATTSDGTRVPLSIVHRRDTPRDGSAPLLLYGYGSYGISVPVNFSSNRLSLLDRSVIYAVAHVRGGGELGKPWHDAGRMKQKHNTFSDFIASAEHLIAQRYTTPEKLVIEGGSAGGLLMGAVTNMRPELFRMVITHVPFVDVLNTMLDASLPLTVGEYEEWGNPQIAQDYFYMKSYCPYTNLERKAYPAILAKTGLNDSQVMYWEPAKYAAKMRTLKMDANPLLLKINMGAGHGGASGRYDYLREIALDYAFLLTQLGIKE